MNAAHILFFLVILATVAGAATDWWTYDVIGDIAKEDRTDSQKALFHTSWIFGTVHIVLLLSSWYVYNNRDESE